MRILILVFFLSIVPGMGAAAQTGSPQTGAYQPKSAGDKAHSDAEYLAMAYMRTVAIAQKLFYRKHNRYADSLLALVGYGGVTRRMASTHRGDYEAGFRARPNGYTLVLTPANFDEGHRSFYIDESGEIRAEEGKRATGESPPLP